MFVTFSAGFHAASLFDPEIKVKIHLVAVPPFSQILTISCYSVLLFRKQTKNRPNHHLESEQRLDMS